MTKLSQGQREVDVDSKILENLIELKSTFGMKQSEIADKLGISDEHLSRVINKKQSGGRQLLAGLELLKELTILNQSQSRVNPDLVQELEVMKRRIDDIQKALVKYPAESLFRPEMVNDPKELTPVAEAVAVRAAELAIQAVQRELAELKASR